MGSIGRIGLIDGGIGFWFLVYQRKDWINSNGKTVPHDHKEDPEYGKKNKE